LIVDETGQRGEDIDVWCSRCPILLEARNQCCMKGVEHLFAK